MQMGCPSEGILSQGHPTKAPGTFFLGFSQELIEVLFELRDSLQFLAASGFEGLLDLPEFVSEFVVCHLTVATVSSVMSAGDKSAPNFGKLWSAVVSELERVGNDRLRSTFLNHSTKKEYICRKYGIISATDIMRVISKVERRRA